MSDDKSEEYKAVLNSVHALAAFSVMFEILKKRKFGGATLKEWAAAIPEAKKIEADNKENAQHGAER